MRLALKGLLLATALAWFGFAMWNSALLEPAPNERAYIMTLALFGFGAVALASLRPAFALVLTGALLLGLKAIAVTKYRLLMQPLLSADFSYFVRQSLFETLAQYPALAWLAAALVVFLPIALWLLWRADFAPSRNARRRPLRLVLRASGAFVFIALGAWTMQPAGPFGALYQRNIWDLMSGPSTLTTFFVSLGRLDVRFPPMEIDPAAAQLWGVPPVAASTAAGARLRPDIIQVLEESTFDPMTLEACTIPACKARMFTPDARTRAHGLLRTHVFGGGTWASEFTSVTGMPHSIFGPAGMYAPYVLAPRVRDSLPRALAALGYRSIAVYPVNGDFINARRAYLGYGFDRFVDAAELGLEPWHASDAEIFRAAKGIFDAERANGQPIYLVMLTLAQHGPHDGVPLAALPPPFNAGLLPELPHALELELSTYLARLADSDAAMSALEREFLDRPEPTLLIHYGDHLPSFNGAMASLPRRLPADVAAPDENLTYFMLKTNFDGAPIKPRAVTDLAFLPVLIGEAAGLPLDDYLGALAQLEQRCAGLYVDCADPRLVASYHGWVFGQLKVIE